MASRLPDCIPESYDPSAVAASPPRPVSRRGGRRAGAGAPRGNLNALRHGRHSRFRHPLAQDTAAVDLAGQVLARVRRTAERHAVTLLRMARIAEHRRALVAVVVADRPLPPALLLDLPDLNTKALTRYLDRVKERSQLECARRKGELDITHPAVLRAHLLAQPIEEALAPALAALAGALAALPAATDLAASLDAPPVVADNQAFNQPAAAAPNLTPTDASAAADSADDCAANDEQ